MVNDFDPTILRAIGETLPRLREDLLGLTPAVVFACLGQLTAEALNALPPEERQSFLERWIETTRATVRPY